MVTECHPTCGWLRSRVLLITHSSSFTFLPFWHFSCSSFLLFTSVLLCWSIHFRHFKLKVVSEIPGFVFKEAAPILEHLLRSGRVLELSFPSGDDRLEEWSDIWNILWAVCDFFQLDAMVSLFQGFLTEHISLHRCPSSGELLAIITW